MTAARGDGAANAAADIPHVDGFSSFADVLAEMFTELDPVRFDVKRTRFTDKREPIDRVLRVWVYKRDNFRCVWCGSSSQLELDHIIPWSAGGPDTFDNLRTLCHGCNTYRSNRAFPLDVVCRQIPGGYQCVYCNDDLVGDPELRPIFCMTCQQKGLGIRSSHIPTPGWEESEEVA